MLVSESKIKQQGTEDMSEVRVEGTQGCESQTATPVAPLGRWTSSHSSSCSFSFFSIVASLLRRWASALDDASLKRREMRGVRMKRYARSLQM